MAPVSGRVRLSAEAVAATGQAPQRTTPTLRGNATSSLQTSASHHLLQKPHQDREAKSIKHQTLDKGAENTTWSTHSPVADWVPLGGAAPLRVLAVVPDALLLVEIGTFHGQTVSPRHLQDKGPTTTTNTEQKAKKIETNMGAEIARDSMPFWAVPPPQR